MRNQRGFGMIEVVMAAALLMIIALAISTMTVQGFKDSRGIDLKLGFINFISGAVVNTHTLATCTPILTGQAFTVGGQNEVSYKDPAGVTFLAGLLWSGLQFTSVNIKDNGPTLFPLQHYATLTFVVQKTGTFSGSTQMIKSVSLIVNLTPLNTILTCGI